MPAPIDQAMVKAMNDIVHVLGKKTIAEFVENEDSFNILAAYGIDYAQGYYLGRPEMTLSASSPKRDGTGFHAVASQAGKVFPKSESQAE
jgi:EAL domain-containing protein (putative c-di-GMP-specific phosphodiesterase class I)